MSDIEHQGLEQAGFTSETPGGQSEGLDVLQSEEFSAESPLIDGLSAEGGPPKKKTGALILIVVIGLAIGSLFSMHTLTKVTASSGPKSDIHVIVDEYLSRLSSDGSENPETAAKLVEDHNAVVAVLTDDFSGYRVDELSRNPFKVFEGGPAVVDASDDYSKAQLLDQYEQAAEKMRLKSVIGGSRPLANINGRIVRLNQMIPVQVSKTGPTVNFKIVKITRDSVTVVAEEPKLELRIEKVITLKR